MDSESAGLHGQHLGKALRSRSRLRWSFSAFLIGIYLAWGIAGVYLPSFYASGFMGIALPTGIAMAFMIIGLSMLLAVIYVRKVNRLEDVEGKEHGQ